MCVSYFTLRIIIILMEPIKDLYYWHGLRPPFLEANVPRHAPQKARRRGRPANSCAATPDLGAGGWGSAPEQASQDLNVHPSQLRDWVKKFSEDAQHAFPGHGQMKPEQLEIVRLKREVAKLKAERDILKKAAAYFAKEST